MNTKQKIKKILSNISNRFLAYRIRRIEYKKINDKRRINIYKKTEYSKEEIAEIQDYYKLNYGKKIDLRWHRLYQTFTGNFDKRYFPEILFSTKLELLLCDRLIARQFTDKSMVELLYGNVLGLVIPKTIVLCCSGIYYDGNRTIISKENALKLLKNCGNKIIKKTIDSDSGRGVSIIDVHSGIDQKNNVTIENLLNEFGNNFIVQDLVKNSADIRKIYPKSLNTFRVITYIVNGKVYHAPLVMRIGKSGNEVDNIHAGGLFIGVNDDGTLLDTAFTEFCERYERHPDTNIEFNKYKINGIDKMLEKAYVCHGLTPHMGMISWDFTIDDKDRIVLIEVNLNNQSIWFSQMAHGKAFFGDNTEYMLKLLKEKK